MNDTSTLKPGHIQGETGIWEMVIGLEIHAQISSKSKLFSGASASFGSEANRNVSLVDAAMPGMLPVINEFCVEQAVKTGLALNAKINNVSVFDRKNYFYADLPQGYQISQFTKPIVGEGEIIVDLDNGEQTTIGIERLHLEQDAGKSLHDQHPTKSYIDLNRTGVALMEIVSKPDIRSPQEAGAYVKKIRSIFAGSRSSETSILLPILIDFIKLMTNKFNDYLFVFHATEENKNYINDNIKLVNLDNIQVISDENVKSQILSNSVFAVSKSGTVSLEICNAKIPSIIIYKMNFINFMIVKFLVKVKFANIINIINNKEVIPELIQNECNSKEIFKSVIYFLKNPALMDKQINDFSNTLHDIRSKTSSADEASSILLKYLN